MSIQLALSFSDVKRVMVDQGNGAEIMYPDLYRALNLKPEDLTTYDSPRLVKAWEATLRHRIKFLGRLSRVILKKKNFLDDLTSQRSPFTTVERTLWSM